MKRSAEFIAEFLQDGHLSIPEKASKALSLKKGNTVRAVIEAQQFDKEKFMKLSGIWKSKTDSEISVYRDIVKERTRFGRGEIKLRSSVSILTSS